MNAAAITSFVFFTAAIIAFIVYKAPREKPATLNSLFFANRKLGYLFTGGALLFTNINTATIIGENELVYTNNMTVMAWGVSSVLAMLLVSEFIMPVYLRTGILTTPDFLELRYDKATKHIVTGIFLVSYLVNLLPSVLYSSAVAVNGLFGFSSFYGLDYRLTIWLLVWLMGMTGCLYTILGGLKVLATFDVLLGLAIAAGCILVPYWALKHIGAGSVTAGFHTVFTSGTPHFNSIGSSSDAIPFSTLFTGMLVVNLYYWGTEQYIVQQVLSSKDLANCQKGIAVACTGKLLSPLLLNIPGLLAVFILHGVSNTTEVFPRLVAAVSPALLAGYMGALMLGAGISTFNAGLNSSGTLFILNFYKPWLLRKGKDVSEKRLVRSAKKFELAASLGAMCIAPFILLARGGFYTYVQKVNGFFNVPVFVILFMGLVSKRVPPLAAKAGLLFFIASYACTQLVVNTGIHFLHILAILFVLTLALMWVIGRLRPLPEPFRWQWNNQVAIQPWKHRHKAALVLLAAMAGLFLLFSRLGLAR
jgi:SSS family solute:Na+ symporter